MDLYILGDVFDFWNDIIWKFWKAYFGLLAAHWQFELYPYGGFQFAQAAWIPPRWRSYSWSPENFDSGSVFWINHQDFCMRNPTENIPVIKDVRKPTFRAWQNAEVLHLLPFVEECQSLREPLGKMWLNWFSSELAILLKLKLQRIGSPQFVHLPIQT